MISKLTDAPPGKSINLQGGWPTPRLHPTKALQEASAKVFSSSDINENLKYGPEHGCKQLRANLACWLSTVYACGTSSFSVEELFVTNGASNGLATILQKFTDPAYTKNIWMVEPTYFLACPIFRDAGFSGRIRGVPEDDTGVDLEYLRRALEDVESTAVESETAIQRKTPKNGYPKIYRHLLYMVPTFSNPSGKTMTLEAREDLVRLARQYDMLIVTDDVYDLLEWETDNITSNDSAVDPPPRVVDIDRTMSGTSQFGNAVSNGSFSKIVAPGVRVGWTQSTPSFVEAMGTVGATVSGGCQGHLGSLIINQMLEDETIQDHIKNVLIPTYKKRHQTMVATIKDLLYPLGVRMLESETQERTSGGFFLYILFPDDGPSASEIARVALDDYQLRIAPGNLFTVSDDLATIQGRSSQYLHGARLCWAWQEEEELVKGIERLAQTLRQMRSGAE